LLSICKIKSKYSHNDDGTVNEQRELGINFTLDQRFIDPATAINLYNEVNNY